MGRRVKVVLLGNAGAGKTCLYHALTKGTFSENTAPTIGGTFAKLEAYDDKAMFHIDLWDTAGQETTRMLVPLYLAGAHVVILCFDMGGEPAGLEDLAFWMGVARESRAGPHVRAVIAGCKSDLQSKFTLEDMMAMSERLHVGRIVETSARTMEGIEALRAAMMSEIEMRDLNDSVLPEITTTSGGQCC